jgi:hypothetical protein
MRTVARQFRKGPPVHGGPLSLFSVQFTKTNAPTAFGAIEGVGYFRDSFMLAGRTKSKFRHVRIASPHSTAH